MLFGAGLSLLILLIGFGLAVYANHMTDIWSNIIFCLMGSFAWVLPLALVDFTSQNERFVLWAILSAGLFWIGRKSPLLRVEDVFDFEELPIDNPTR